MWPALTTRAQKSVRMIPRKQGGLYRWYAQKAGLQRYCTTGGPIAREGGTDRGEQKCAEEPKDLGGAEGTKTAEVPGGAERIRRAVVPGERKGSGGRKCPEVPAYLKSAVHFKGDWNYALEKSGFERPGFPEPAER